MTECCGKTRLTRFCPACGKQLQQLGVLGDLLGHLRKVAANFRKNADRYAEEAVADGEDSFSWRRHRIASQAQQKWETWALALEALMAKGVPE